MGSGVAIVAELKGEVKCGVIGGVAIVAELKGAVKCGVIGGGVK